MTATTTPLATNFVKDTITSMLQAYTDGQKRAAEMYWRVLMTFLSQHAVGFVIALVSILALSIVVYVFTTRWAFLGSVLWHYLYFGILFIIGLTLGPDTFVSDIFHEICVLIFYPVCYFTVRIILNETGIRKH